MYIYQCVKTRKAISQGSLYGSLYGLGPTLFVLTQEALKPFVGHLETMFQYVSNYFCFPLHERLCTQIHTVWNLFGKVYR